MTSSTGTDVSRETSVEPKDRPEHLARAVDAATMESELAAFKDPKLARGLIAVSYTHLTLPTILLV